MSEPSMIQLYNKITNVKNIILEKSSDILITNDLRQKVDKHLVMPESEIKTFIPFYEVLRWTCDYLWFIPLIFGGCGMSVWESLFEHYRHFEKCFFAMILKWDVQSETQIQTGIMVFMIFFVLSNSAHDHHSSPFQQNKRNFFYLRNSS